jgi:translation initiation factor 2-alpha kinase 4
MVKHEGSGVLKIRSTYNDSEAEISSTSLISYIRAEVREREQKSNSRPIRTPALLRQPSHPDTQSRSNVQVLMSQHRSKKSNKYHIVEAAQQKWSETVNEWKEAPILAIETRDDVLDSMREARLGDADSWRKVTQSVQLSERQYVAQVHDLLLDMRKKWHERDGSREACVFNFRTGSCIYYDLGS